MIERVLLNGQGEELLSLFRHSEAEALLPLEEGLPDILPVGQVQDIAGTGIKMFVGGDQLTAGSYSLTLGTYGRSHMDNFSLQRTVMQAAVQTRAIRRSGLTLPIARFASIKRTFHGGAQLSGRVTVEFVPTTPYWLTAERRQLLETGQNTVHVDGMARAPLRVSFVGPVTDPSVTTDAGVTTWLGTVPSGRELVIDARPGVWTAALDGDRTAALRLNGPQPYLNPGSRTVSVTHPATLEWQEGEL